MDQIKYVAVNPEGNVCGPVGDTENFVMESLCMGYMRARQSTKSFDEVWPEILGYGYSIGRAKITLLD